MSLASLALHDRNTVHAIARRGVATWVFGSLAACATGPAPVRPSVRAEPVPSSPVTTVSSGNVIPAAPSIDAVSPALSVAPERRIAMLDVPAGTPISVAVVQLGAQLGLSVTVDPAVRGTAQASLRNVTVDQALREIVSRNGAAYEIQNGILRVTTVRMETRTFPLDYVAVSRVGSMSTVLQRRLPSASMVTQESSSPTTGRRESDGLAGETISDIWKEIRVSLTGIIGGGQGANAPRAIALDQNAVQSSAPAAASIPFSDGSSLVLSPMSGLISITASPDKLAAAERFISEFQSSVLRQVMIQAKIVEVTLSKEYASGLDWSAVTRSVALSGDSSLTTRGNTGTVNFTLGGGSTQVDALIDALKLQGDVRVLSSEQASALNNQRAIFNVTTDEVFFNVSHNAATPQQVSVGVVLDVVPQISADNVLTMNVHPSITHVDRVASVKLADGTTAKAPVLARREGDTVARLRGGETMIIAGLDQSRRDSTTDGVPVLQDLPLLGKAFQHTTASEARTELVVFLTPTIIAGPLAQPATGR
jgi:type II secretory pathway component GspD/PulD (secretin)